MKILATGQVDDYMTGCLWLFLFWKLLQNDCNRLRKQQFLDADPRAIQQISFTVNLNRAGNIAMFFIIEEAKKNCVRLFASNCKSFANSIPLNNLIFINIKWRNTAVFKQLSNSQLDKLKSAIKNGTEIL